MVAYALLPQGKGFVIHVRRLATHTADMLSNPAVGLLVTAPTAVATSPQELPRASVQGNAQTWAHDPPAYAQARASLFDYLEVFYNRQRRHSTINYGASLAFGAAQTAS